MPDSDISLVHENKKMNSFDLNHLWSYLIFENGQEMKISFQCHDCILLEFGYQMFLQAKKMNELLDKAKNLKLIDGVVDFCTFEIKIYNDQKKFKIFRASYEKLKKRKRPKISGPSEANNLKFRMNQINGKFFDYQFFKND